ncbi:recQ-mediated genome instability protein 1-like isoform X3 [Dysidea avara]|uniref:recQ-mediated genome instability protein 1-like isoform X3 n=1 Tax=Dysidea avara TaxID=196820 RepID=UPI003318EBB7
MERTIREINRMLNEEKGISCKFNWLTACVEWVLAEEQMVRNVDYVKLRDLVYEQWLLSDLSDSSSGCLPLNHDNHKLNGTFLLQVNSVINVGVSAYSQLQKLKGQEIDATDSDKAKNNAEAKPTRMLVLQLTDGSVEISAMEYHIIPSLSTESPPGVKIKLIGPVESRLGMLLLTSQNVTVLGGEVEHLADTNSQKKILSRIIDTQSNGSSVVEPSRAMPSNDAANGENHPPISRTNQNAHQTFTGHRATHSVSTANNNIGHQPSTQYDDDVDDDFDAAVMNVDLDMFENNIDLDMLDDDFGQESHANQEGENHHVTTPSNNVSTHSSSVEMKGISEILSVVKDNTFCGTLHTKVLELLIGFSAREFKEEIEPNKSVVAIKTKGVQGFQQCHYSLANLECSMELSLIPNSSPIITKLLDSV